MWTLHKFVDSRDIQAPVPWVRADLRLVLSELKSIKPQLTKSLEIAALKQEEGKEVRGLYHEPESLRCILWT